jgi:hypothetical protein
MKVRGQLKVPGAGHQKILVKSNTIRINFNRLQD